jgi:NADPH:quinone reductase-like Zn-dependent oxidoreductase
VQLAHAAGARVIGAGRSGVKSAVMEAGADSFADVEQASWEKTLGNVDLVYDLVGGDVLAQAQSAIKPGGALVTVVSPPAEPRGDIRVVNFIRDPNGPELKELARMVDEVKLRPQVGAVYPFSDAQTAFSAKDGHQIGGKVILMP